MTWKISQKSNFGGRGAKWVKVEGDLKEKLYRRMDELSDFDFSNLKEHFKSAGFAWIRYSKPVGSEDNRMASFEIRWSGCKTDCPKTLFEINEDVAFSLEKLGTTPFKLGLEGKGDGNVKAPKKAIPKKDRSEKLVSIGPSKPTLTANNSVNSKPSSSKETVKQTEVLDFDLLCKELGI